MISFFLFSVMLLLQFLEVCIGGAFDLWPAYVHKILFSASSTPENIRTLAAFFYGHDVPLGVASTTYTICKPHRENIYLIPHSMWVLCELLFTSQYLSFSLVFRCPTRSTDVGQRPKSSPT